MTADSEDLTFGSYLKLKQILSAQEPLSAKTSQPAHDEMMYIVVHQAYELWFKLVLFELDSVIKILNSEYVDERDISRCVSRFKRLTLIQELLVKQFEVLETMTPLDFLDFRGLLGTASGFQSLQFRLIENRMGMLSAQRLAYANMPYNVCFKNEELAQVKNSEAQPSLFNALDKWLKRTPFVICEEFNFLKAYEVALAKYLSPKNSAPVADSYGGAQDASVFKTDPTLSALFEKDVYEKLQQNGTRRLSWESFVAALFISLYRDEPMLQLPFQLLQSVVDFDERWAIWRSQHALLVHRMLGRKTGTGGSAGYEYLKNTVEKHRVFVDLYDLSSYLLPKSALPKLPFQIEQKLNFNWSSSK